jgi:hypothetical protein
MKYDSLEREPTVGSPSPSGLNTSLNISYITGFDKINNIIYNTFGCYHFIDYSLEEINMSKYVRNSSLSSPRYEKISIPGVQMIDLLELENEFPDIRLHLATIMLPVCIVAQIRLSLLNTKPNAIMSLPSVNAYNRNCLAKSKSITYVSGVVAIRKTLAAHTNDETADNMILDHNDLMNNLSGPISTRGGLAAALTSPEALRSHRRGIMAQTVGKVQAAPVHNPRIIARDVENITLSDFLPRLPFKTDDLDLNDIINRVNQYLAPSGGTVEFIDYPMIPNGKVSLEEKLYITRIAPALPDITTIPANIESLPAWKRAAINQARNFNGGGKS